MTLAARVDVGESPDAPPPIVEMTDVKVHFPVKRGHLVRRTVGVVHAVDGVNLRVERGTTVALVGESGSGKTTLGRAIMGMVPVTEGVIKVDGRDISAARPWPAAAHRSDRAPGPVRIPRPPDADREGDLGATACRRSGRTSGDGFARTRDGAARSGRAAAGQPHEVPAPIQWRPTATDCDRAGARAEPPNRRARRTDVGLGRIGAGPDPQPACSDLQRELGHAYILISHNLVTVAHVADTVAVMYLGRIVEVGTPDQIFRNPQHPYTRALHREHSQQRGRCPRWRLSGTHRARWTCSSPAGTGHSADGTWRLASPPNVVERDPVLQQIEDKHMAACHFPGDTMPAGIKDLPETTDSGRNQ